MVTVCLSSRSDIFGPTVSRIHLSVFLLAFQMGKVDLAWVKGKRGTVRCGVLGSQGDRGEEGGQGTWFCDWSENMFVHSLGTCCVPTRVSVLKQSLLTGRETCHKQWGYGKRCYCARRSGSPCSHSGQMGPGVCPQISPSPAPHPRQESKQTHIGTCTHVYVYIPPS